MGNVQAVGRALQLRGHSSREEDLIEWVRRQGGQVCYPHATLSLQLCAYDDVVQVTQSLFADQNNYSSPLGRQTFLQADVRIEAPEAGAPRGILAERGFSPDEVIMSIPESIAIPFEGSPEEATVLLLHLKHNRQRQNQYRSWLNALPGPQDFVAWDTVEDETLSMLQCPEMVRMRPAL